MSHCAYWELGQCGKPEKGVDENGPTVGQRATSLARFLLITLGFAVAERRFFMTLGHRTFHTQYVHHAEHSVFTNDLSG